MGMMQLYKNKIDKETTLLLYINVIVEVKTKRQLIFPLSEMTNYINGNKSTFERENR